MTPSPRISSYRGSFFATKGLSLLPGDTHAFRLIVFDFDGTLVDSQHAISEAMGLAFVEIGLAPPANEDVRRVVGLNLEVAISRLLPETVGKDGLRRAATRYREAFFEIRTRHDFDEPLFPGVHEALTSLNTPDVCLAIATGKSRRGLMAGLERHTLSDFFVTLKTADDGPGKPHPAILEDAMAEVGATPEETVVIGDTSFDMAMARNAGAMGIGAGWGYHTPRELLDAGAAQVLEAFAQVPGALVSLRPSVSEDNL